MATATFDAAPTCATDADFRDWGSKLSTAIQAVGLVKTADTGQISWGSVLKPSAGSTYGGYEFYRFNDSLQSTTPIFIKLEFGAGTSTNCPGLRITVGKATNGAGAFVGTTMTNAAYVATTAVGNSSMYPWHVSSADGSQLMIAGMTTTNLPDMGIAAGVERSRDVSGNATSNGGVVYARTAVTGIISGSAWNYTNPTVAVTGAAPSPPGGAIYPSLAVGGVAPMFPATTTDGYGFVWQPRALLAYANIDCAPATPITVTGWGTYLPLGTALAMTGAAYNYRQAMRWS